MKERFDTLVDHLLEGGFFLEEAVEILERKFIEQALSRADGNRSVASKALGIHRNTLQRKMMEYELTGSRTRRKPMAVAARKGSRKSPRKSAAS
jgi:DNA-binding NtrC family response regulator